MFLNVSEAQFEIKIFLFPKKKKNLSDAILIFIINLKLYLMQSDYICYDNFRFLCIFCFHFWILLGRWILLVTEKVKLQG